MGCGVILRLPVFQVHIICFSMHVPRISIGDTLWDVYKRLTLYFTCSVVCPSLENITNGVVSVSGDSVGDTAHYTCVSGFYLNGASVVNCQINGRWDKPPPTCQDSEG